jgi:asparagine synthase (glutamine-hydrolysing)
MCGICGLVDFSAPTVDERIIVAMTRTLRHRGPDDCSALAPGPVGLGHARLSSIDLTKAGHQPMQSTDSEVALVYNGEVYNFQILLQLLEKEALRQD